MIAALLVIITNSLVFVIFKLFQRHQVHIKRAIIINYTTAVIISYFAIRKSIDFNLLWNAKWIIPAVIIGIIYVLNFYLINLCTKNFNLAVTSLSGKISVVIPILIGIIILHEAFGWTRVVGILLALLSLFLILKPKNPTNFKLFFNTPAKILKLFIPIALFLFYGISDALFQVSQKKLFYSSIYPESEGFVNENAIFVLTVFSVCFIFSILFTTAIKENPIRFYKFRDIIGGIALGVVNLIGGFMLLEAVSQVNNTGVLFAVINISVVILTTMIGILYFKEKLRPINIVGIVIALLALVLLNI